VGTGSVLLLLALLQLTTECTHVKVSMLNRFIHRASVVGVICYAAGWTATIRTDNHTLLWMTLANILCDMASCVLVGEMFILAYLLLRALYTTHTLRFPTLTKLKFSVVCIALFGGNIFMNSLGGILDMSVFRVASLLGLGITTISTQIFLWKRYADFQKVAAAYPGSMLEVSEEGKKFLNMLRLSAGVCFGGCSLILTSSGFYFMKGQANTGLRNLNSIMAAELLYLIGAVVQSLGFALGIWYGWLHFSPSKFAALWGTIATNPLLPNKGTVQSTAGYPGDYDSDGVRDPQSGMDPPSQRGIGS